MNTSQNIMQLTDSEELHAELVSENVVPSSAIR